MTIKRIDHVAIVVPNLEEARRFYEDILGLEVTHVERADGQAVTIAFMPIGESEIELLEPTTEDSGVARFLEKRGPGIHHICFEVDDITSTLNDLKTKGVQLIHEEPVTDPGGKRFAFVHPRSTFGVLIEFYELPSKSQ
jgi:methylmalonyl-CoA epimerase